MKNFGKVAVGVFRESRRAHCAVIFAIAQLSCQHLSSVVTCILVVTFQKRFADTLIADSNLSTEQFSSISDRDKLDYIVPLLYF